MNCSHDLYQKWWAFCWSSMPHLTLESLLPLPRSLTNTITDLSYPKRHKRYEQTVNKQFHQCCVCLQPFTQSNHSIVMDIILCSLQHQLIYFVVPVSFCVFKPLMCNLWREVLTIKASLNAVAPLSPILLAEEKVWAFAHPQMSISLSLTINVQWIECCVHLEPITQC